MTPRTSRERVLEKYPKARAEDAGEPESYADRAVREAKDTINRLSPAPPVDAARPELELPVDGCPRCGLTTKRMLDEHKGVCIVCHALSDSHVDLLQRLRRKLLATLRENEGLREQLVDVGNKWRVALKRAELCPECGHPVDMHLDGTGCTWGHTNQYCKCERGGTMQNESQPTLAEHELTTLQHRDHALITQLETECTALRAELDAIRERTEKAVEWLEHPASLKTVEVHNALRALKGK